MFLKAMVGGLAVAMVLGLGVIAAILWIRLSAPPLPALPEAVTLNTVPQSDYRYAYVNGVPVVVDPAERRVVHIVR